MLQKRLFRVIKLLTLTLHLIFFSFVIDAFFFLNYVSFFVHSFVKCYICNMKKYVLTFGMFFGFSVLAANAQDGKALRDSLASATDVLAFHPDSIDLRLKKVAWNIQLEQWNYAKDDLDKVLFLDRTNIAGLFFRAFVNEKLKRYNFARLDYQNLLTLVPGNFQAQLGLALLNEKDRHFTEAYDGINNLIEQYPDSATAYAARGGMEKERGMLELAEYDYQQAVLKDSLNRDYRMNHADVLISLGRKQQVMEELNQLIKLGMSPGELRDFYVRLRKKK